MSFEYPQHMFLVRNKNIIFLLSTRIKSPGKIITNGLDLFTVYDGNHILTV